MGFLNKVECVVCNKEFRKTGFSTIGDCIANGGVYRNTSMLPEDYEYDDPICGNCKEEWKGRSKAFDEEYKKRFCFGEAALLYKSKYTAVMHKTNRNLLQFVAEFDSLTKEGYRCVAQDEGTQMGISLGVEISGGLNSYYYFQKINHVSCKEGGE